MRVVIIIEDSVYTVSERECEKLKSKSIQIKQSKWPISGQLENDLNDYLDENKSSYKLIASVEFDFRR